MKLLLILCCLPFIFAFKFSPMSTSIELGDDQKHAQFFLENDSNEPMAIELTVKERVMNEKGEETLPDAKDVSIFPPQVTIPAKEKRTIRLTWNGDKKITDEKAFRVIAEQLPIDVNEKPKKKSGIQMLMRYMAALYVTPDEAEASIGGTYTVEKKTLKLKITNSGNQHLVLLKPFIQFKKNGKKWTLNETELKGIAGENVLAKSTRVFEAKLTQDIPAGADFSIKVND